MGWFGYGHGVPQSARDVAKAFYAGRSCKRTNCRTDGESYWLEDSIIATRVLDEDWPGEIAKAILGHPHRMRLGFSFCGWATEMTCRHLRALGVEASIEKHYEIGPRGGLINPTEIAVLNGVWVNQNRRYSLEELASMPKWQRQVPVPRPARRPSPENLSLAF